MARQRSYDLDRLPHGGDKILITDVLDNQTKNLTIEDLATYFTGNGQASSERLGFQFTYLGQDFVEGNEVPTGRFTYARKNGIGYNSISNIYVSATTNQGVSFNPVAAVLSNNDIKITDINSATSTDYGFLKAGLPTYNEEFDYWDIPVSTIISAVNVTNVGALPVSEMSLSIIGEATEAREGATFRSGTESPVDAKVEGNVGDVYFQRLTDEISGTYYRIFGPLVNETRIADDNFDNWGTGFEVKGIQGTPAPEIDGVTYDRESDTLTFDLDDDSSYSVTGVKGDPGDTVDAVTSVGGENPGDTTVVTFSIDGVPLDESFTVQPGAVGNSISADLTGAVLTVSSTDPDVADQTTDLTVADPIFTEGTVTKIDEGGDPTYDIVAGEYPNFTVDVGLVTGDTGPVRKIGTVTPTTIPLKADDTVGDATATIVESDTPGTDNYTFGIPVGLTGEGITGGVYDSTDGTVTISYDTLEDTVTGDLRGGDGRTILNGTGDPKLLVPIPGSPGDFYIDTTDGAEKLYGPKGSDDVWPDTFVDLVAPTASIEVENPLDLENPFLGIDCFKFVGSGVGSVVRTEDCVTITISGGGGGVVEQVEDLLLTDNFDSNMFSGTAQTVTIGSSWTAAADYVITSLTLSSDYVGFTDVVATDPAAPSYDFGSFSLSITDAGNTFTVTMVYVDGDGLTKTVTNAMTFATSKAPPADYLIAEDYNDTFVEPPQRSLIEEFDEGTIQFTPQATLDGWEISTPADDIVITNNGDGTLVGDTLTVGEDDQSIDVTVTTTYTNPDDDTEFVTDTADVSYTRVKSFRFGSIASTESPDWTDTTDGSDTNIKNLSAFKETNRTIKELDSAPAGTYTFTPAAGDYNYFAVSEDETITSVTQAGFDILSGDTLIVSDPINGFVIYTFSSASIYGTPTSIKINLE